MSVSIHKYVQNGLTLCTFLPFLHKTRRCYFSRGRAGWTYGWHQLPCSDQWPKLYVHSDIIDQNNAGERWDVLVEAMVSPAIYMGQNGCFFNCTLFHIYGMDIRNMGWSLQNIGTKKESVHGKPAFNIDIYVWTEIRMDVQTNGQSDRESLKGKENALNLASWIGHWRLTFVVI